MPTELYSDYLTRHYAIVERTAQIKAKSAIISQNLQNSFRVAENKPEPAVNVYAVILIVTVAMGLISSMV